MPVFISHRTADDQLAQAVRNRLTNRHDIPCYLDNMDQEAGPANQTNRLTALIVSRVNSCTNLLALVTENTRGSWWVPFEIGVARQAPRMITSFTSMPQHMLPEYLTEWPVLRGENAIDQFAYYYKQQQSLADRYFRTKTASAGDFMQGINTFHQRLKAALGQ